MWITFFNIPESVNTIDNSKICFSVYNDVAILPGNIRELDVTWDKCDGSEGLKEMILMDGITTIKNLDTGFNDSISSIEIPSSVTHFSEYYMLSTPEVIIRGKTSLDDFEDATGLTAEGDFPEDVNIIFRP